MPNERRSPSERYEWYQAIYETPIYNPVTSSVTWTTTNTATEIELDSPQQYNYTISFDEIEIYLDSIYGKKERKTKLGNSLD